MTIQKIEGTVWAVISFFMLIIAIFHPRIIYWILLIVCVIKCIVCCKTAKKKTVGKFCIGMVSNIIAILILCDLGQGLNLFFPYHASYEYEKDIEDLKADSLKENSLREYSHFPDELPTVASGVKWMCVPNFMQGTGYDQLFFFADEVYLQKIYNAYAEEATIYTYSQYDWVNNDTGKCAVFPDAIGIDEAERKNVEVFILYDNEDFNHLHNSGFYINQTEGYICFWAQ